MMTAAHAQWFDLSNNTNRYEFGINLGMGGAPSEFHDFGFGFSLNVWGVYLDFLTAGPMYREDNRVASMNDPDYLRFLPDSTTTAINLGYQIPVLPWLRLMPLFGVSINSSGHTDMATHNVEISGSGDYVSGHLTHDYNSEKHWTHFNFGGGLVISPIRWMSLYGVYTTHAIYGGLSFNLGALVDE